SPLCRALRARRRASGRAHRHRRDLSSALRPRLSGAAGPRHARRGDRVGCGGAGRGALLHRDAGPVAHPRAQHRRAHRGQRAAAGPGSAADAHPDAHRPHRLPGRGDVPVRAGRGRGAAGDRAAAPDPEL
ncbi:MAG: hypothetical protein AVDCRST_MAG89-4176, partial [uncultured Gemmatimonadetes bacterium]